MPFGSQSCEDTMAEVWEACKRPESPMPFGSQSCEDPHITILVLCAAFGHQCLSAVSPVRTPSCILHRPSVFRHQCLSAVSPVRTRNRNRNLYLLLGVTNAFRQSVL